MKKNKIASTLIEAVVVVIIVSVWLITIYGTFIKAREFLDSVSNKIVAVEIAREWIEAMENIRNTNWLKFPWNYENCWDTFDYDENCLNEATHDTNYSRKIGDSSKPLYYTISSKDWIWYLGNIGSTKLDYWNTNNREKYLVRKDKDNLYCQRIEPKISWTKILDNFTECPLKDASNNDNKLKWDFAREIKIERPESYKMIVRSKVMWAESWRTRQIEIVNLLTNYKEN